jgi:RNA polymerase sigma factor (sigma-70 family)
MLEIMMTNTMPTAGPTDTDLVTASLSGSREAFGQIVGRYQSLVCSLAYNATGSLTQSEDVAQETFLTAWRRLRELREPAKLRPWLCQIARHRAFDALRRQKRVEPLEAADDAASIELSPPEQTISNEEEAILWRSVGQIPESYREPLILFYREGHSVRRVAEALDLTEDTVKQRLSRGRKLLHTEVMAFVEGTLERTTPREAFTQAVLSALPPSTGASLGSAVVKGALAKGIMGGLAWFGLIICGNYASYRTGMISAQSEAERKLSNAFTQSC